MKPITDESVDAVYKIFRDHIETYGWSPSYEEVGGQLNMSAGMVWHRVQILIEFGLLTYRTRIYNSPRNLMLRGNQP